MNLKYSCSDHFTFANLELCDPLVLLFFKIIFTAKQMLTAANCVPSNSSVPSALSFYLASPPTLLCPPPLPLMAPCPGILRWFPPTERTLCSCEQKTRRWLSPGTTLSWPALPAFCHGWRRSSGPNSPAWMSSMWAGLRSRCGRIKGWCCQLHRE